MTPATQEAPRTATLAQWKKAKRHNVTLPSGVTVAIEIPDLPELLKTGQIPNDLIEAAIKSVQGEKVTPELIEQQPEFYKQLVLKTVAEPKLTEADYDDIPYEDKEMIVELATRQRDLDALGHHIAGLHTSRDFRRFRGLDNFDEDVADL
jgi:hypothetical protein